MSKGPQSIGMGPQGIGGGGDSLSPEQLAAINSIIALNDGQVPQALAGVLEYSGATVDPITGEWTFDKSINVPSASVNVGQVVTLSEGDEELLISNNINNSRGYAVKSKWDETGSQLPDFIGLGAQFNINLQPDDSTLLTANPLAFSIVGAVTPPDIRQTNQVTFRSQSGMMNLRARITDNASGMVLKYIPNQAAWDAGINGIDFIAGDNIVDFISNEPDSAGVFNIGVSPFILASGQQIDVEIVGDTIDLLGAAIGFPYLSQLVQDGPMVPLATEESLNDYQLLTDKAIANGYASLDGMGMVPPAQLPSYVSAVQEYAKLADFPVTGEADVIYIAIDTNLTYRWSGSSYVELTDTTAVWGNISGLLSNQTDLKIELDAKLEAVSTDSSLTGDGTSGDPLSWVAPTESPVYGELYRLTAGNQQVTNVDEVIEFNAGTALGTTVSTLTNSITVLEAGRYKASISGSISTRRDKESYGKVGVNGVSTDVMFVNMPESDGYYFAMSGSRVLTLAANDVVTFVGFVDDGMNRQFYLQEGSSFIVEKL